MHLIHHVHKPADIVFDYLTDMKKFAALHPVIDRIEHLKGSTYLVYETLKVGFLSCSFTYTVYVESDLILKQVRIHSTIMKIAHIEMLFTIQEDGHITIVYETIQFRSFLPITGLMKKIFTKQHVQLFKNMQASNLFIS